MVLEPFDKTEEAIAYAGHKRLSACTTRRVVS